MGKPSTEPTGEKNHVFGARCPNGHVNYFDKRDVCHSAVTVVRRAEADGKTKEMSVLLLTCQEKMCGEQFQVSVDCEGYR